MRPVIGQPAVMPAEGGPEAAALADRFRLAMRQLGAQVSIVAAGTGESLTGIVVTSLSSLSVAPPAVSVAVARTASVHPVLASTGRFGVSGLTPRHRALADRFAGRDGSKGRERFEGADWIGLASGAPVLADAAFALDCAVEAMIDWHTHSIVIGRVLAASAAGGEGLVYRDGAYGRVAALP